VKEVRSDAAPAPIGPYSQAVVHGGLLFASGQIPIDPATGKLVDGDVEAQTERVFANPPTVLRATVYLTDLSVFPRVNAIYEKHLGREPLPARSTVGVAALPMGAAVEIDLIAHVP